MKAFAVSALAAMAGLASAMPHFREAAPAPSDDTRLMYEIASIANLATMKFGDEAFFAKLMKAGLTEKIKLINKEYGTDMDLVWGPAFKMTSTVDLENPDDLPGDNLIQLAAVAQDVTGAREPGKDTALNAHYITYDKGTDTYYLGLAATNGASASSWFLEDFWVSKLVDWKYDKTGKAKKDDAQLFAGTDISLRFTTDTKPIKSMPGAGKTIAQFLKGKKGTVRVAGISLAGALAPAVALYLQDNNLGGKITCDLFAGASPGNGGFAKYYDSRPVAENTVRTVNQYDMIPKAWVPANIDQIPTLYTEKFPKALAPECTQGIADFLTSLLNGITSAATVNPQKNPEFSVGFNPGPNGEPFGGEALLNAVLAPLYGDSWEKCKDTVFDWMAEAGWQHGSAYQKYLTPVTSDKGSDVVPGDASADAATSTEAPTATETETETEAATEEPKKPTKKPAKEE